MKGSEYLKKKKGGLEFGCCTTISPFLKLLNGTEAIICNDKVTDWDLEPLF